MLPLTKFNSSQATRVMWHVLTLLGLIIYFKWLNQPIRQRASHDEESTLTIANPSLLKCSSDYITLQKFPWFRDFPIFVILIILQPYNLKGRMYGMSLCLSEISVFLTPLLANNICSARINREVNILSRWILEKVW